MDESTRTGVRRVVLAAVMVALFLSSYSFAIARSGARRVAPVAAAGASGTNARVSGTGSDSGSACACCGAGTAAATAPIEEEATVQGDVQTITVDASGGRFAPDRVVVKSGVPVEMRFTEGKGCLAKVVFPGLGLEADLTSGGALVRLPALPSGEYGFSCGMNMVFGTVVAR